MGYVSFREGILEITLPYTQIYKDYDKLTMIRIPILRCPRKLGSVVYNPKISLLQVGENNPLILTFDPNKPNGTSKYLGLDQIP